MLVLASLMRETIFGFKLLQCYCAHSLRLICTYVYINVCVCTNIHIHSHTLFILCKWGHERPCIPIFVPFGQKVQN